MRRFFFATSRKVRAGRPIKEMAAATGFGVGGGRGEGVALLDRVAFREDVAKSLRDKQALVLFVPGFNTTFQGAAESLMRITSSDFVPALFSWPCCESVLGYTADLARVEASRLQFAEFLADMLDVTAACGKPLHLASHSMGGRIALDGLLLAAESTRAPASVLFAAPDVDCNAFSFALSKVLQRTPTTAVLLASARDHALRLSGSPFIHQAARAGFIQNGRLCTVDGAHSIDCSMANGYELASSRVNALVGHTYFEDDSAVIGLIHHVFSSAAQRAELQLDKLCTVVQDATGQKFFKLAPSDWQRQSSENDDSDIMLNEY